ncbi:MAG: hypothetical protein ABFS30_07000 [Pseudomonadota bacterium]
MAFRQVSRQSWVCHALPALSCAVLLVSSPARAVDDEHPYDMVRKKFAVHQIVQDIDQASFAAAVAHYPGTDDAGHHRIAMGRYIMWKIVALFQVKDRVRGLRLAQYSQRCRTQRGFTGDRSVSCGLAATLSVSAGRETHLLTHKVRSQNVGRLFSPARPAHRAVVRAQVRGQVDAAVADFARQLRQRGVLPPK